MRPLTPAGALLLFAFAQAACAPSGEPLILRLDGSVGGDTGVRPSDGAVPLDAGFTPDGEPVDTGAPVPDSGNPPVDGGVGVDTGQPVPDSGVIGADSGPRPDGGRPPPSGAPYAHASEAVHELEEVFDLRGRYGVALAGGHLIAANAQGGSTFPRETTLSSSGQLQIPAGATVRHAFLWYSGIIFLKPGNAGQGDYTADRGGDLDDAADVAANGISFSLNGGSYGPFDPTTRTPPNPSNVGSQSQLSGEALDFTFGTWTGIRESVWANRLDITGLFSGVTGTVPITVNPPERLDMNGNNATSNGGNPAGNTRYNSCSGAASWAVMVIYEEASLPEKNLVLMDGGFARAWDYVFFHNGTWKRPKVRVDHAPIQPGAKFYTYVPSGNAVGSSLPGNPACTCGCGGFYTLKNQSGGLGLNSYFSNTHEDPPAAVGDPMHRDRTNGPWYLHNGGLFQSITGNDWTLFQSADIYTEFPNLYEGNSAPAADNTNPVTNEDDPDASHDTYAGHPWNGRGTVRYHASGNAISLIEVTLDPSRIVPGETSSYVYLKGDQKDVWKPQHIVSMKWLLLETPL